MQGADLGLSADAALPLVQFLEASVIQANPFLAAMTAADVQAWADRKMSGKRPSPSTTTPSAPTVAVAASSPEFAAYRSAIATLLAPATGSGTDKDTQEPNEAPAPEDNA